MKINQERFFDGLGFEKKNFRGKDCWLAPNGHFYRMDYFQSMYVIEYSDDEYYASYGSFDDADFFDDNGRSDEEIIKEVQAALMSYVQDAAE